MVAADTASLGHEKLGYAQALETDLVERHGLLIGGEELRKLLCYPTVEAFRQAVRRGRTPVPVFPIPHRRGYFAITKEIAAWLMSCREHASQCEAGIE
jgi:hypothetical protein